MMRRERKAGKERKENKKETKKKIKGKGRKRGRGGREKKKKERREEEKKKKKGKKKSEGGRKDIVGILGSSLPKTGSTNKVPFSLKFNLITLINTGCNTVKLMANIFSRSFRKNVGGKICQHKTYFLVFIMTINKCKRITLKFKDSGKLSLQDSELPRSRYMSFW